jgi:hypothetical protein
MYIYTIIYFKDTKIGGFFLWQYSTKNLNTVTDWFTILLGLFLNQPSASGNCVFDLLVAVFSVVCALYKNRHTRTWIKIQMIINSWERKITPMQGLKLRKYFRGQVGPHQINFGSPHNLLGAHQARIVRLPPRLQGALRRGVRWRTPEALG